MQIDNRTIWPTRGLALLALAAALLPAACTDRAPPRVVQVPVPTAAVESGEAGQTGDEAPATKGPRIALVPDRLDFGSVIAGEVVKRTVQVHNRGDAVLHLSGVRVGCGCVKATLDCKELAPGESAPLEIEFRSEGSVGPTEKSLRVLSDDPRRRGAEFQYEVEVVRLVELRPDGFDFTDVLVGDGAERAIDLVAVDEQRFSVQSAECRDALLQFTIEDFPGESPCRVRVRAILSAEAPQGWPGMQPLAVYLNLDHPRHPRFKVAVTGAVRSPVRVDPNLLDFGKFERHAGATRSVEVRHLRASPPMAPPQVEVDCRANDLLPDPAGGGRRQFVVAEVVELEDGSRYRVDVRVEAGYPLRTLSGHLRIQLATEDRPRSIPLLGTRVGR